VATTTSAEMKSVLVTTEGKEGVVVMHLGFVGQILMDPCYISENAPCQVFLGGEVLHFAGQHL
jgi:hypothetical protein